MNNTKIEPKVLSGMQSVRTTFNISEKSIRMIQGLSESYKIKPKEIFDILLNDNNSYIDDYFKKEYDFFSGEKKKKTYVISKNSLDWLNIQSKKRIISRDKLVECSLWGFFLIYDEKKKEREKKEKEAVEIINYYNKVFWETSAKLKKLFGEDDDIVQGFFESACDFNDWDIFDHLNDESSEGVKQNDNN